MKKNSPLPSSPPSTLSKPPSLPCHVAIVMDGNGRWAKQRGFPRIVGHKNGVASTKAIVKACSVKGIGVLTLFAFSTENWRRPQNEVSFLMQLIIQSLSKEARELHANGVQVRVIGCKERLSDKMRQTIVAAEKLTENNTGLKLVIAINYSGRWDIEQATQKIGAQITAGTLQATEITEELISAHLETAPFPDPDLFIRTGGEIRISNFLLWQLAYSELYFADALWPDFREAEFEAALAAYATRERRFGKVSE